MGFKCTNCKKEFFSTEGFNWHLKSNRECGDMAIDMFIKTLEKPKDISSDMSDGERDAFDNEREDITNIPYHEGGT